MSLLRLTGLRHVGEFLIARFLKMYQTIPENHYFLRTMHKKLHKMHFFCAKICTYQKFLLTLHRKTKKINKNPGGNGQQRHKIMKRIDTYLTSESIIAFKIHGGGGNRRKLDCLGEHSIGDYTSDLYLRDGQYYDEVGHAVGLTEEEERTGIGTIDIDGEYDTTYTKRLKDIEYTDEEAYAMAHAGGDLNEEWVVGYFCNEWRDDEAMLRNILAELRVDADYYLNEDED